MTSTVDKEIIKIISDSSEKKEKVMFSRKMEDLNELLAEIQQFETKISEMIVAKQPLLDQLFMMRKEMVKICVHPREFLEQTDDGVICKFCNKVIKIHGRKT